MEQLAIANRRAARKGMPKLSQEDARRVTAAILAMRGVNQRKQKQIHQEGNLKLHRRTLAYKGLSRAWLRNYSMAKEADDWTKSRDKTMNQRWRPSHSFTSDVQNVGTARTQPTTR